MKALYRKYRPVKLSEVIGQDQVVRTLENSLKSHKISHAYLFTGPRGCGKTSVARIFAHEINGFKYELEDSYVDIIEIDAASNTGVDNIRELREKAMVAPTAGKFKVYIIDEVHMLSKSAFNALLKTLEEPPAHVVFIMATTDAYKVPVTITSRAQNFTFQLASPDIMKSYLKTVAEQEKIDIDDDALDIIVTRGGGSFRDSISLLDQISTISTDKITAKDIVSALGVPETTIISQILEAYESGDFATVTELVKKALETGTKPEIFAETVIDFIIKNPRPAYFRLLDRLPSVSGAFSEAKLFYAFLSDFAITAPATAISRPVAVEKPIKNPEKSQSVKPEPVKQPEVAVETGPFSWEDYLEKVTNSNRVVGNYLKKAEYRLDGQVLSVSPERAVHKNVLSKSANLELLRKYLPAGIKLEILDFGEKPQKEPSTIDKISGIIGGIQEVTDGNPF